MGDFFILKTVYKENEDMRTKTTHILLVKLAKNFIYDTDMEIPLSVSEKRDLKEKLYSLLIFKILVK